MRLRPAIGLGVVCLLSAACAGSSGSSAPPPPTISSSPLPAASVLPSAQARGTQAPVPAESNPPGDIPDNLAFVPYANAAGHYRFTHPEGWTEQVKGTRVAFTEKLNGVTVDVGPATTPPTVTDANTKDVPQLRSSEAAFELRTVAAAAMPGGKGVQIVYRRNSDPDPVTGRQYRDEVQRFELVSGGREVIIEMFGPVGADNVDAYRTMIQSVRIA